MSKTKFHFTEASVTRVKPCSKVTYYTDAALTQLKLCVLTSGQKSYYVRFSHRNKKHRIRIGNINTLTVDTVRIEAGHIISTIKGFANQPCASSLNASGKSNGTTVDDAVEAYRDNHLMHLPKRKEKTHPLWKTYINHLRDDLGDMSVESMSRKWLAKYFKNLFDKKGYAVHNKCVICLKAAFNYCLDYEDTFPINFNPCARIKKRQDVRRARYLDKREISNLLKALDEHNHSNYTDLFKLCLYIGARVGNLKSMRWDEVDLSNGLWLIPETKTKTAEPYYLALSSHAISILSLRKASSISNNEFVFPSKSSSSGHITGGIAFGKLLSKRRGCTRRTELNESVNTIYAERLRLCKR